MYLPPIPVTKAKRRKQIVQFGGLNYGGATQEGEIADSYGISCEAFPQLTQRPGREVMHHTIDGSAMYAWGKLCHIDNGRVMYGGKEVGAVTPGKKQFAVVNTKLCIFPDKKYLDLKEKKFGSLDERLELEAGTAEFTSGGIEVTKLRKTVEKAGPCLRLINFDLKKVRFKVYEEKDISWSEETGWTFAAEPKVGTDGEVLGVGRCLMMPKSKNGIRGRRYPDHERHDGKASEWVEFAEEYDQWGDYLYITDWDGWTSTTSSELKIIAEVRNASTKNRTVAETGLKPGDVIYISGSSVEGNNKSVRIKSISGNWIWCGADTFTPIEEKNPIVIERKVPNLDYICSSGNRLWGVSNEDGTIYGSAWGDPENFYLYDAPNVGAGELSYSVPVGTDGKFTGCMEYSNSILFWKKDCIHKLLGDSPDNYELYTYQIAGLQEGSADSQQIINEVLYYKGEDGVYMYTGGTPRLISYNLGQERFDEAVGGTDGRNYYISMRRRSDGKWETLVYNTVTGLWVKEDTEEVRAFATLDGELYALTKDELYRMGQKEDTAGPIKWMVEFTPMDEGEIGKKNYTKLYLRLELGDGAWAEVEVAQDKGGFRPVWSSGNKDEATPIIPIRPGRCEKFRVRVKGEGEFKLEHMVREYAQGSGKR